jgi:hypothetical protein
LNLRLPGYEFPSAPAGRCRPGPVSSSDLHVRPRGSSLHALECHPVIRRWVASRVAHSLMVNCRSEVERESFGQSVRIVNRLKKLSRSCCRICLSRGRFATCLLTSSKPQQRPEKQSFETLGIVFLMPQHADAEGRRVYKLTDEEFEVLAGNSYRGGSKWTSSTFRRLRPMRPSTGRSRWK